MSGRATHYLLDDDNGTLGGHHSVWIGCGQVDEQRLWLAMVMARIIVRIIITPHRLVNLMPSRQPTDLTAKSAKYLRLDSA
ncbi:MAG TPA: hypothetical protein VML36_03760, partial [Nitrospiria bacterium]|nr:hypothetical protein [Nitrospiria bacterium]